MTEKVKQDGLYTIKKKLLLVEHTTIDRNVVPLVEGFPFYSIHTTILMVVMVKDLRTYIVPKNIQHPIYYLLHIHCIHTMLVQKWQHTI